MRRYDLWIDNAYVSVDGHWLHCKESLSDTEWVKAHEADARIAELSAKLTALTLLPAQANPCTAADRAVLDAMAKLTTVTLQQACAPRENNPLGKMHGPCAAELARREAAK